MNYAMIPINRRLDDFGERIVRRVLISYVDKDKTGKYEGSRFIESDPYFKDKTSSHQYLFRDDGFILISNSYISSSLENSLVDLPRPYEFDAGKLIETAYEFTADSDEQAIKVFKERDF